MIYLLIAVNLGLFSSFRDLQTSGIKEKTMIIQSILGFFVFVAIAWACSENRRKVKIMPIFVGIAFQLAIGLVLLKLPIFRNFFLLLNRAVLSLEESTNAGTSFVFGYLGGGDLPFVEKFPGASFILSFQALPIVIVMSALSSLLFYWKVLPLIVRAFSWVFTKTMKIGGAEALSASINIFVGMVEAPLLIRPYLKQITRSELFAIMTCGMANIAGTVMVLYASLLSRKIPDVMGHILTASIISIPASITISKIMVPETKEPTAGELTASDTALSSMDAITKGTIQGLELFLNIIAMLIVLVSLVYLTNLILGLFPDIAGRPVTLQRIFGIIMAPIVWLIGIPWSESSVAGALMGTKTILNELIAYLDLANLPKDMLSPKSMLIMTYAMCGFANPGSLGIMIGGMGSMVPERRDEIVELGFRTILGGTLSSLMTGAVVGIIA
jgi:CNT family concentrative nucleoside transporter